MPTVTATAHACSVHGRVHVPQRNAWLPLAHPQVAGVYEEAVVVEAACDLCLMFTQRLFQRQFPGLYVHKQLIPS